MNRLTVDNAQFKTSIDIGAGKAKQLLWYAVNLLVFKKGWLISSSLKCSILRGFGAQVGSGVVIKPCINIKYPWKLVIGNHSWIGEQVWIDNLDKVVIGNHVCISQGAFLLTGNHNYKKISFDLMTRPIHLEDGAWVGAMTIVCPGVVCKTHSILSVGSVATSELEPYGIYKGNPAIKVGERNIQSET